MESNATATTLAEPIGILGMSYYFSPHAIARGEELGQDVVTFYAGGRAGVLGQVSPDEADEIFMFFKSGMVSAMVEKSRSVTDPEVTAAAHLEAAWSFADATFGAVPADVLDAFSEAARALAATLERGRWPLVDGYLDAGEPVGSVRAAYYWTIVLRELRGGVHTDAVKAAGLSGAAACQLDRGGAFFALHGYGDEDRLDETEELIAARAAVEESTDARMATLLEGVSADARVALARGAEAMFAAIADPVAV